MAAITQIKRDPEQAYEVNQSNLKHLEEKFEVALKDSKEVPAAFSQSNKIINEIALSNEKSIESMQDRASYLRRVILANQNDSDIFSQKLLHIQEEEIERKNQYEKDLEQQKSEQQEMENEMNTKIQAAIHQLKSLKSLQELRRQLEQQTRAVKKLIEEEKQLNSNDMTSMKHQINDQRKFYEDDLNTRLEAANRFAKDFSDLHMELATAKIMNETIQNRKQLQEESVRLVQFIKENATLRKKHFLADQEFKISQKSLENIHSDYSTLRLSVVEYEEKMNDTLNEHKNNIRQLRDEKDDTIGELKLRKEEALQNRNQLNQELLSIKKNLQRVETLRSESSQKEYEVLDKMSQSATFILTAIDRAINSETIQETGNLNYEADQISIQNNDEAISHKSAPRRLNLIKNQENSQKSELTRLMLRLQSISQQLKEDALKSQSLMQNSNIEKKDAETQTDIQMKLDSLTKKMQPLSLLERAKNHRRKPSVHTFRRLPPIHKRLFEKSKAPLSVRQTSFV